MSAIQHEDHFQPTRGRAPLAERLADEIREFLYSEAGFKLTWREGEEWEAYTMALDDCGQTFSGRTYADIDAETERAYRERFEALKAEAARR